MVQDKKSAPAKIDDADLIASQYSNLSYAEMKAQAAEAGTHIDAVAGFELEKNKEGLEGEAFMITGLVFRPSTMSEKEYVSIETVTDKRGTVVFNDGSTGVRRQVMNYLIGKRIAAVPVEVATKLENLGDVSASDAEWVRPANATIAEDGSVTVRIPVMLDCPRGLRKSEFNWLNPETGKQQPAVTWYLS